MTNNPASREVTAALWYRELVKTTNESFLPLFSEESRYLVLMGGGGSGKSVFAGRKIIERAASGPGHRFLVCRKVASSMRESCRRQIAEQAARHMPGEVAAMGEDFLRFKNGSEIIFRGLGDTERLKSLWGLTGIWIEEASEISEEDFTQLDIRLRGESPYYKQIILTFNPVSATHWLKRRFWDHGDPRAVTHRSTYRDNRFLDAEYIKTLESLKQSDEYYYTVYCLGMWGSPGASVFGSQRVSERLAAAPRPVRVGYFECAGDRAEWRDDPDGFIRIYEEPKPGTPYVLGGDTAGEGGDFFVAQVIDNTTGRQAAVLRHRLDEDLYARQVDALGRCYNGALAAIETNFSTYPVLTLERMGYPNLYVRESVDEYTHRPRRSFGFQTNSRTRPLIIAELIRAFREDSRIVADETTLYEMLTFTRGEDWRAAALSGAHDDCVMALAIAHFARGQQSMRAAVISASRAAWSEDMQEDWRRASPEERAYLEQKWAALRE